MRAIFLALPLTFIAIFSVSAQPPVPNSGVKLGGENFEAEVLKVYSMQDQGATYRAYVVNYKGHEVVADDNPFQPPPNVGDKINLTAPRVELPLAGTINRTVGFHILRTATAKKNARGAKAPGESFEAEVSKVYSTEDQGNAYRAYVVKYKGTDVVAKDTQARSDKKLGDKITVVATRTDLPTESNTIKSISFEIAPYALKKK